MYDEQRKYLAKAEESYLRVALVIEYDGTNYCGWQVQKNGVSIQQKIEEALQKALGRRTAIHGSGRTDAGVHALGQVAHFEAQTDIPADKFFYVLNDLLPQDIRIIRSYEVADDFHARFCAKGKHYRYVIHNARAKGAVNRLYSMFVPVPLDMGRMEEAAKHIEGTHDFSAFCAAGTDIKGTVRTVDEVRLGRDGDYIIVDVVGSGFLYNRVRIIAGTLIAVGKGKMEPAEVKEAIDKKDRTLAGATAQAQGLFLVEVFYTAL
ncbi:MAG: tRNA pseudouridine(38-40) synthase TruA [Christensenella sp.]|uniref:tRNA pseudouridine(38-40) synthase TruA n=1 Tax=Christensenella sp. TaxID=1935934 RepID=UPI002B1F3D05|nr:tRNA pseudouridine(38-40) synthase TruA [Christensenella sp.]MEA5002548.1 tRNA pseudouridine(38-40) synthase TruA [Christensenella sp.]